MNNKMTDFLYFAFDIVLFVLSIVLVTTLMLSQYEYISDVQDASYANSAVSKTMPENTMYNGYVQNGEVVYDGEITGKQVYTDILNGSMTDIVVRNGRLYDLKTELYDNKNLLATAREDNPTVLMSQNVVNVDATYLRKYIRDTDGNVVQLIYEKQ
jgi:hypothetical protein